MAKINLGRAVGIVEQLKYVLDKISKKHPQYEFEPTHYNEIRKQNDETQTITKEEWVRGVNVYDGPFLLGEITFGVYVGKENKHGEHPEAFGISSHKVKKLRGDRGTIITADPGAAVRHALKVLTKKTIPQICKETAYNIVQPLGSLAYNATYKMREMVYYVGDEVVINFIEHKLFGVPLTIPNSFRFNEEKKGAYDNWVAAKQIADAVEPSGRKSQRGYAVSCLRDGSILVVNLEEYSACSRNKTLDTETDKYATMYRSFEDLPEHIQDRVAVLKVAEAHEPVFNMGVRTSHETMDFPQFFVLSEADQQEYPHAASTV